MIFKVIYKNTVGAAAGLPANFTAHLGRSCLRHSPRYAPAHDQPSCTREIDWQFQQLMQYWGQ